VAKKMFFWKKPEEVYLMRNAIDLEKFTFSGEKRNAIREALGIGRDALVLGHVGRFAKEKNHSFLLDVFSRLRKLQPEARLLLLGDGELFEAVKAEAARAGLADGVIFAGRQADVGAYMSAMDVFVMPSLFEGLGIVLIEAQANGLPCVASDQVPLETKASELIEYLPLRGDVDRWVEAVQGKDRLLGRPAALEAYEIGGAAEELVEYYERFI
jgi:glycosyltransferase involved in cell wall biosynthesis